ncbi:hypothetical protein G647_07607 [Cladophialophora carrionii CBS 160.54]|uniref:TATA element modulatory factor 1 TATA binding domain-containing protein n=1 Tax=Cladophialophora carrionii CBS 160.54 TaxID=1279043 RepID=V9D5I5_9EURO|nr:uncharacterized protein G647_07607 [Cladophialophora carrionii CBS 160.54]ETI21262.1 hypothetical protein G647_07607 [Cladophialophora carrionii CBS 160.54]
MAAKPRSGWNFLQQAVASVESRLDDILAEDGERPKRTNTPPHTKKPSSDLSRSNSNASGSNDRLQERLARAMAKKSASRTESPVPPQDESSSPISRAADLTTAADDAEAVTNTSHLTGQDAKDKVDDGSQVIADEEAPQEEETTVLLENARAVPVSALQSHGDTSRASTDALRDSRTTSNRPSQDIPRPSVDSQTRQSAAEILEAQAEMNVYLERIDALRRDLQTLVDSVSESARKNADTAKQAAYSAEPGSLEQKISQKDEKIALLIEEGTRWSKTEMELRSTIKKIRAQATASAKEQETSKIRAEKAEQAFRAMEDRAKRAEAANKRVEQNLALSSATTKDLEAVRKERDSLNATLADMKAQLSKANARAEAAENKAQSDQLDKERKRVAELRDDLTSAKVERQISEEKLRQEIKELQAALEREKGQARAMESEMLSEQAALESKLESFRIRAEEASSADTGHTQAKLLRQIETLQNQYAAASQNWQGIETSLLGRIANLEKERDEVVSRDAELRKKSRDTTLKLKNAERELDSLRNKYADMDKSLADANEEVQRLQKKTTQLEQDLTEALKDLETQKQAAERELLRRIDEEKAKWTANLHIPRTESPAASLRKNSGLGFDMGHLMSPVQFERATSRRSSIMHNTFDSNTPPRQQSTTSFRGLANGSTVETPSVVTSMDHDEYFANVPPTPLTTSHHSQRGVVNDLISTSTVGAGPSVQLVERMSANVRRLESEKAASKDELARLTTQRDEARQEVVSLMREAEEKRRIEERLRALEKEHASLSQRHQTTLELLGEKSEQVEELKADILDVKQMYRQLADTMK